jgi:hypothetical protein
MSTSAVMRFLVRIFAAVTPLLGLLHAPTALSAECNLDRRSAAFGVTLCGPKGCITSQNRIEILGDKILFYNDPRDPNGPVYRIGRTVDFSTDSLQGERDRGRPAIQGTRRRALGTASRLGNELVMSEVETTTFERTGQVIATSRQEIRLVFPSCSSCAVTAYDLAVTKFDGTKAMDYSLADQVCLFR